MNTDDATMRRSIARKSFLQRENKRGGLLTELRRINKFSSKAPKMLEHLLTVSLIIIFIVSLVIMMVIILIVIFNVI